MLMPIIWWLHKRELHKCNAAVRCMRSRSTSCYACNGQSFFRAFRWCGTLIFDFAMSYAVTSDLWICLWGCLLTSRHSFINCLHKIWKVNENMETLTVKWRRVLLLVAPKSHARATLLPSYSLRQYAALHVLYVCFVFFSVVCLLLS